MEHELLDASSDFTRPLDVGMQARSRLLQLPNQLLHMILSPGLTGSDDRVLIQPFYEMGHDGQLAWPCVRAACRRLRREFNACNTRLYLRTVAAAAGGEGTAVGEGCVGGEGAAAGGEEAEAAWPRGVTDVAALAHRVARSTPQLAHVSAYVRGHGLLSAPAGIPPVVACERWPLLLPADVLRRLRRLDLDDTINVVDASFLAECVALQELRMDHFVLRGTGCHLAPLSHCSALRVLGVTAIVDNGSGGGGAPVLDLSPLAACTALHSLCTWGPLSASQLRPLEALAGSLTHLDVQYPPALLQHLLPQLLPLTELCYLALTLDVTPASSRSASAVLSSLASLPRLSSLALCLRSNSAAPHAIDLSWLQHFNGRLKHLALDDSSNRALLPASLPARATALEALRLDSFHGARDFSPLAVCKGLLRLEFHDCVQLEDIAPFAALTALTRLYFVDCYWLADLRPLAGLKALQVLALRQCSLVTSVSPLTACVSLKRLFVGSCGCMVEGACLHVEEELQDLDVLMTAKPALGLMSTDILH